MDLVSVIIPLYNTENYISETVNSVLNQTYSNFELIIINDGSTDKSLELVTEFAKKDNRIKIINQVNSGVASARNIGIKHCNGDYLFFLDSDDLWLPKNIELRIEYIKKNNAEWIFGAIDLIGEKSELLNNQILGKDGTILNDLLSWNGNVITTPSTVTLKKKCIEKTLFDENLSTAADQDFAIQLASNYKGMYFPTPTIRYRVLKNSMSRNISLMESDHLKVFNKAKKNRLFKNFWFKQKCFSNLYWILAGSWWKNGKSKSRALYYIILATFTYPLSLKRFL